MNVAAQQTGGNFMQETFAMTQTPGPLLDAQVNAVIHRLVQERRHPANGEPRPELHHTNDPHAWADYGFSIQPQQGDLIYLLCRAQRARRVAEFATSVGMSALYAAAAVRDNGGGVVIGSELVPKKAFAAWRNLTEAGLGHLCDIRVGDARQTLRDLGGPVDFMLIDGWPGDEEESLALQVMKIAAPQIRVGGLVMNDNGEEDYLEYVRDPANGFRSMSLPLKGSTELSVKVS
jgi:predicted O-methyltransferase YrrM